MSRGQVVSPTVGEVRSIFQPFPFPVQPREFEEKLCFEECRPSVGGIPSVVP